MPVIKIKWAKSLSWTITDKDGDKWNPFFLIGNVERGKLKAHSIILGPIHLMVGFIRNGMGRIKCNDKEAV